MPQHMRHAMRFPKQGVFQSPQTRLFLFGFSRSGTCFQHPVQGYFGTFGELEEVVARGEL